MKTGSYFELVRFAEPNTLAQAAAHWLKDVAAARGAGVPYWVALAGGRIAHQFLAAVANRTKLDRIGLGPVHFFWGDERCVPPTDTDSNFGLAREFLFRPLGVSESQLHRLRGEELPEFEAEAEMRRYVPTDGSAASLGST